jgi:2-polyprenyl-6-methoxyphenol hydroxylase-like FAD-dependent oxidoreductase
MHDVLVAGAGPAGLVLACDLARRGIDCRVIDRAQELFIGSRAKGLQPRTLEVFDDLGVIDAIRAGGAPFPEFRLYSGERVCWERSVDEMLGVPPLASVPAVPYPRPWLIPQWRTDRILADRFAALGGKVELGTALTGFAQDADGVSAATTEGEIRARYLVGCDGGRSTVRKALGVGFAGDIFETERTLIGDVRADGLHGEFCHILTRDGDVGRRFSLWNLPESPYYQVVASMAADEVPELTLDAVQTLLVQRCGRTDIRLHDPRWLSLYRVNVRMARRYRVDRVLLAGDAAHVHSSASGQGLNTSVQDAYNLGWKIAGAVRGASDELLDSYEAERRPVAADVLGLSTMLHLRNFGAGDGPTPGRPCRRAQLLGAHRRLLAAPLPDLAAPARSGLVGGRWSRTRTCRRASSRGGATAEAGWSMRPGRLEVGEPAGRRARSTRQLLDTGGSAAEVLDQALDAGAVDAVGVGVDHLLLVLGVRVEPGPPLHERLAGAGDRGHPDRGPVAAHRERAGVGERIGVGAVVVVHGQQDLGDLSVLAEGQPAHRAHLLPRAAALDLAGGDRRQPAGQAVELLDQLPDLVGGGGDDPTGVGLGHDALLIVWRVSALTYPSGGPGGPPSGSVGSSVAGARLWSP